MRKRTRMAIAALLALVMVVGLFPTALATEEEPPDSSSVYVEKVDDDAIIAQRSDDEDDTSLLPALPDAGDPNEVVRVSIVMDKPATLDTKERYSTIDIASNASAMRYRDSLRQEQISVQSVIERTVLHGQPLDVEWHLTLAANIISANVRRGDIEAIKEISGVADVVEEAQFTPAVVEAGGELKPNMAVSGGMNGTATAWEFGYTGAGSKIAIIDTGIDYLHQSFDSNAFEYAIQKWQEDTGRTVTLMTEADTAEVLSKLNIANDRIGVTADKLYLNSKIPFAYNYVDSNYTIDHMSDNQGEHGSHVAGISAGNRFIPVKDADGKPNGTYEEALATVKTAGNAPDAQLIIMKVFGLGGGAYESDYMAAIEDAILLGADSINLSLGGAAPGFAISNTYQSVMDILNASDTVLSAAAGNAGNWAEFTTNGALYSDDVPFSMLGKPGSFNAPLTVASVDNDGLISTMKVGPATLLFYEGKNAEKPLFPTLDPTNKGKEFEYLLLDRSTAGKEEEVSLALAEQMKDRIVVCWRGDINFSTKANAIAAAGAAGILIANNVANQAFYADMSDPVYIGKVPVACVTMEAALQGFQKYAERTESSNGYSYSIGKMMIYGQPYVDQYGSAYKTMSVFSSWGTTESLTLKPDISAPGGNIWSVWGENASSGAQTHDPNDHNDYELMSGTSMAAPQVAGMAAQVQQYLRETGRSHHDGLSSRALTESLLMSTAAPMKDKDGSYYPVLQQGAGLANVGDAVSTPAYITVDGRSDGKAKAELGDDPERDGVYTITFQLHNMSEEDVAYDLTLDLFTQAVETRPDALNYVSYNYLLESTRLMDADISFSVDGVPLVRDNLIYDFNDDFLVTQSDAQLLLDYVIKGIEIPGAAETALDVDGDGDVDTHDVHTLLNMNPATAFVPAGESVTVTAVITLTDGEKAQLEEYNPKGAYVEGFLYATSQPTEEGLLYPTLSVPILGYYGSWTDPSMFEWGTYTELYNQYAQWYEYIVGYRYAPVRDPYTWGKFTTLSWAYSPYNILYATVDKKVTIENEKTFMSGGLSSNPNNAFSSANGLMSFSYYYYSMIRNAGGRIWQVSNHDTGEVYNRSKDFGQSLGAYYTNSGFTSNYDALKIDWDGKDWNGKDLPEGAVIDVSIICAPEYYMGKDGKYDWDALTDRDPSNGELGKGAYLTTSYLVDNTAPEFTEKPTLSGSEGNRTMTFTVKDNNYVSYVELYQQDGEIRVGAKAVNQKTDTAGATVTLNGLTSDIYLLRVWDKAYNSSTYRIFVDCAPTKDVSEVRIYNADTMANLTNKTLSLITGTETLLYGAAYPVTLEDRTVTWSSSNDAIAHVDENGLLTVHGTGSAVITATSAVDQEKTAKMAVSVTGFDKEFGGLVKEEDGSLWYSKVKTDTVPEYDRLKQVNGDIPIVSLAYNGKELYGLTFTSMNEGTDIYKINPETLEATLVARTATPVTAATNSFVLDDLIVGISGTNVVFLDPKVGLETDALYASVEYTLDLTAIAYEGTVYKSPLFGGTLDADIFYLIGADGNIYEDFMYVLGGTPTVYFHAVSAFMEPTRTTSFSTDMPYYSSAYFDGHYMYWSRFYHNQSDVIVWNKGDKNASGDFYRVGSFNKGAGPLTGLIDLDNLRSNDLNSPSSTGSDSPSILEDLIARNPAVEPYPFEQPEPVETPAPEPVEQPVPEPVEQPVPSASVRSIDVLPELPTSNGDGIYVDPASQTVTVPIRAVESTNGDFTLIYDADLLHLVKIKPGAATLTTFNTLVTPNTVTDPETGAISVKGNTGALHVGYAGKDALNVTVITAVFHYTETNVRTTLDLAVTEDGATNNETPAVTSYTVELGRLYTPPIQPSAPSTPSTPSTPDEPDVPSDGVPTVEPDTTVTDGEASATVDDNMAQELVDEAERSNSDTVVIAPKAPEDADTVTVTIPGDALADLADRTDADVRVETYLGDVTLPNEALDELGGDKDVTISISKKDPVVAIEVSVGGTVVETIPGGIKVALPLTDGQVAVLIGADGSETILPKSLVEDGMIYVLLDGSATVKAVDNQKTFSDVTGAGWYTSAVAFVSSHELFNGTGDGQFSPDASMDRGMLATVLWRLENKAKADGAADFTDVAGDAWYAGGVAWASQNGIVKGYGDGIFAPETAISREELAVMLYRYAKYVGLDTSVTGDLLRFADAHKVSSWAEDAVKWASANGLLTGKGAGLLDPTGNASRAEVATILQRLVKRMVK